MRSERNPEYHLLKESWRKVEERRGSELLVRPGTGRAFVGDVLDPVQASAHSTVDAGVVSLTAPGTKAVDILLN